MADSDPRSDLPECVDRNRRRLVLTGLASVGLVGCGGGSPSVPAVPPTSTMPATGSGVVFAAAKIWPAMPRLQSTAASGRFTATLSAAPASVEFLTGISTNIFGYNGGTPGPVIDAFEGDVVRIAFSNNLGQDTTVHWHGLPIPADQDGNPMDPVATGTTREYVFALPIGSAGTYWYHPHPHETAHQQVYRGLAGVFIVRSRTDPLGTLPERLVLITDLRLDSSAQIAADTATDLVNGREGDHVLVNGAYQPVDVIAPGTTERWRILDATNGRYTRLVLDGAPMVVVALDGCALASPVVVTELLLAPGQRAELIVRAPAAADQKLVLRTLAYDRGAMVPIRPAVKLLEITTGNVGVVAPFAIPNTLLARSPLPGNLAVSQTIVLADMGMAMGGGMGGGATGRFTINGKVFDPDRDDITIKAGVAQEWLVRNDGMMDHPLHIHGTSFQLVASNRANMASDPRLHAFMDIVNLKAGEQVRIRLRIDTPGRRMFHCHILEHEAQGMMGVINVTA